MRGLFRRGDLVEAVVIYSTGLISRVEVKENGKPLYLLIRKIIGGYMENTYPRKLPEGYIMIVNENGKFNGLPVNGVATIIYGNELDFIVGNVIILKFGKFEGESDVVGMTEEEANEIMTHIHQKIIKYRKRGE